MTDALGHLTTALADRYVIEREVGAGGMANVYLARDVRHDRHVALKVLRPELAAVLGAPRFLAEIKITARLDHPHILTLIDSGEADGFLFYVLPFIRGESLRDKLNREKQLGMEEALQITKHVAGALDYAHRQGVVHRDIKPENILLHEGEAMLTDFGIALAVKEAGGNRLTETGLSLGTPMYMSPEQATGDRGIDARSDVYSLAAVLYEMLAGEPPLSGPTVQAIIAKLLTERPTHLRVVRDTVPVGVDEAVARALSKTPADRFPDAAQFARALEQAGAPSAWSAATPAARQPSGRRRAMALALGAVALLGAALGGYALLHGRRGPKVSLGERQQLTYTGGVVAPAISPDGKQLAFFSKTCVGPSCSYAIQVQDVGGTTTARVLDGATAAYALEWSPDRRHLLATMSFGGHFGIHLVSTLGGPPRNLGFVAATFYAGGDSLLVGPPQAPDSVFWIRVTSLDGTPHDSIRVAGAGDGLTGITVVPGTRWIIALVPRQGHGLWQVLDRSGRVADHVVNSCQCAGTASSEALWLVRSGSANESEAFVRLSVDRSTGRLGTRQDTLFSGKFSAVSVTADGKALVVDDITSETSVWALDLADALRDRFPESRRVLRASSGLGAMIAPDGQRLLVTRAVPRVGGGTDARLSVMPFPSGDETPLQLAGALSGVWWRDSVTLVVSALRGAMLHLALLDVRTGAERQPLDVPDSTVADYDALAGGWAIIPTGDTSIEIRRGADVRTIPKPPQYREIGGLYASPDGTRLVFSGQNAPMEDTLRFHVVPVAGGPSVPWFTIAARRGYAQFLPDGSLLAVIGGTSAPLAFYQIGGPGRVRPLGALLRPVSGATVSSDLRRAAVATVDRRADAWLNAVVQR